MPDTPIWPSDDTTSWDDAVLTTDANLTQFERRMPQLAMNIRGPAGASAYDGKRQAAKDQLRRDLRTSKVFVKDLTDFSELQRAATFLELSLIFFDMADRNDNLSFEKASFYRDEYKKEFSQLVLDRTILEADADPLQSPLYSIPCYRE
jgi:hypothetical protein